MFGHSPATRLHATRTGSWLEPEALTDARGLRRYAAAFCVIAVALALVPFAAMAARHAHLARSVHAPLAEPRQLPYPRLEWPLEISGSQYAPVAWADIAGWSEDDHLQAYKAF